ncbi:MAG: GMC family oxidoreductase, partial [Bacteroidota bacterium]
FGGNYLNEYIGERVGGYGTQLKKDVRKFYGATMGVSGRGECIARVDNYCEIDPNVVDEWGIPVLRFNYTWSDHEYKQAQHMHQTFEEIFDQMGAEIFGERPGKEQDYGLNKPGEIIHEVGTVRMGDNPKKSATNAFQQLHDCKNVFVTDGGTFVSQADKNPTWTILALAWRTSDYITEELKKMNI